MSFKVEIEITPDADGVSCNCPLWIEGHGLTVGYCVLFRTNVRVNGHRERFVEAIRCPACLAAERAWMERQEVISQAPGETDAELKARITEWMERNP